MPKPSLFFFLFALLSTSLAAQSSQADSLHAANVAFLDTSAVWSIGGTIDEYRSGVTRIRIAPDSNEINGVWYQNIQVNVLEDSVGYVGSAYFLREADGRVFIVDTTPEAGMPSGQEQVFYDFSVTAGDTIPHPELYADFGRYSNSGYVESIDSVRLADGTWRKRYQLLCKQPGSAPRSRIDTWIEGIGSVYGFMKPAWSCVVDAGPAVLICYARGGEVLFRSLDDCNEFTVSVASGEAPSPIRLYPNPTTGVIEFPALSAGRVAVSVFDGQGRLVVQETIRENRLDLSGLRPGLYHLYLLTDAGERSTGRVILIR
ncbi:putative secreted protein (Por secretion system target) [Neolewinella xylanilytica]|uniref:Putative secreted protein (Por secretion system target) n=1 Tax=Neolewinella xylanilytica TaxID=1514080 RepID=A0A2S6I3S2_9BACT|nr:T9SS type A sorting domain-containing protein [Neolewinella xylanilytica]PPK85815.1 putative secreted protein (Por secretion system target) [Neolewinella xylanilytica]